jgi:hypothetical protein
VIRKSLLSFSIAAMVILTGLCWSQSSAQTPSDNSAQSVTDQDIDLLRKDVRSQKRQIIASNLQLTDQEAVKFWPLYDQYTADLVKINDAKYAALKEFASSYSTLTDDQATGLVRKMLWRRSIGCGVTAEIHFALQQRDTREENRGVFPVGSAPGDVD